MQASASFSLHSIVLLQRLRGCTSTRAGLAVSQQQRPYVISVTHRHAEVLLLDSSASPTETAPKLLTAAWFQYFKAQRTFPTSQFHVHTRPWTSALVVQHTSEKCLNWLWIPGRWLLNLYARQPGLSEASAGWKATWGTFSYTLGITPKLGHCDAGCLLSAQQKKRQGAVLHHGVHLGLWVLHKTHLQFHGFLPSVGLQEKEKLFKSM